MHHPAGGHRGALDRQRRQRVQQAALGCALTGAIVVAPFLALLYALAAGLAVMALALGATALLAVEAARGVPSGASPRLRRRLLGLAVANGVLAVGCVVALIARLAS